MTLQDSYEFLRNIKRKNKSSLQEGYTKADACYHWIFTTTIATPLHARKIKKILESLLKHNGEYDLEIRVIDETIFPSINRTGELANSEKIKIILFGISLINTNSTFLQEIFKR